MQTPSLPNIPKLRVPGMYVPGFRALEVPLPTIQNSAMNSNVYMKTFTDPLFNLKLRSEYESKTRNFWTETAGRIEGAGIGAAKGAYTGSILGAVAAFIGSVLLTTAAVISPVPGDEVLAGALLAAHTGAGVGAKVGAGVGAVGGFIGADYTTFHAMNSVIKDTAGMLFSKQAGRGVMNSLYAVGKSMDIISGGETIRSIIYSAATHTDPIENIMKAYGLDYSGRKDFDTEVIREELGIDLGNLPNIVIDIIGDLVTDPGFISSMGSLALSKDAGKNLFKKAITSVKKETDDLKVLFTTAKSDKALKKRLSKALLDSDYNSIIKELGDNPTELTFKTVKTFVDKVNAKATKNTTNSLYKLLFKFDNLDDKLTGVMFDVAFPPIGGIKLAKTGTKIFNAHNSISKDSFLGKLNYVLKGNAAKYNYEDYLLQDAEDSYNKTILRWLKADKNYNDEIIYKQDNLEYSIKQTYSNVEEFNNLRMLDPKSLTKEQSDRLNELTDLFKNMENDFKTQIKNIDDQVLDLQKQFIKTKDMNLVDQIGKLLKKQGSLYHYTSIINSSSEMTNFKHIINNIKRMFAQSKARNKNVDEINLRRVFDNQVNLLMKLINDNDDILDMLGTTSYARIVNYIKENLNSNMKKEIEELFKTASDEYSSVTKALEEKAVPKITEGISITQKLSSKKLMKESKPPKKLLKTYEKELNKVLDDINKLLEELNVESLTAYKNSNIAKRGIIKRMFVDPSTIYGTVKFNKIEVDKATKYYMGLQDAFQETISNLNNIDTIKSNNASVAKNLINAYAETINDIDMDSTVAATFKTDVSLEIKTNEEIKGIGFDNTIDFKNVDGGKNNITVNHITNVLVDKVEEQVISIMDANEDAIDNIILDIVKDKNLVQEVHKDIYSGVLFTKYLSNNLNLNSKTVFTKKQFKEFMSRIANGRDLFTLNDNHAINNIVSYYSKLKYTNLKLDVNKLANVTAIIMQDSSRSDYWLNVMFSINGYNIPKLINYANSIKDAKSNPILIMYYDYYINKLDKHIKRINKYYNEGTISDIQMIIRDDLVKLFDEFKEVRSILFDNGFSPEYLELSQASIRNMDNAFTLDNMITNIKENVISEYDVRKRLIEDQLDKTKDKAKLKALRKEYSVLVKNKETLEKSIFDMKDCLEKLLNTKTNVLAIDDSLDYIFDVAISNFITTTNKYLSNNNTRFAKEFFNTSINVLSSISRYDDMAKKLEAYVSNIIYRLDFTNLEEVNKQLKIANSISNRASTFRHTIRAMKEYNIDIDYDFVGDQIKVDMITNKQKYNITNYFKNENGDINYIFDPISFSKYAENNDIDISSLDKLSEKIKSENPKLRFVNRDLFTDIINGNTIQFQFNNNVIFNKLPTSKEPSYFIFLDVEATNGNEKTQEALITQLHMTKVDAKGNVIGEQTIYLDPDEFTQLTSGTNARFSISDKAIEVSEIDYNKLVKERQLGHTMTLTDMHKAFEDFGCLQDDSIILAHNGNGYDFGVIANNFYNANEEMIFDETGKVDSTIAKSLLNANCLDTLQLASCFFNGNSRLVNVELAKGLGIDYKVIHSAPTKENIKATDDIVEYIYNDEAGNRVVKQYYKGVSLHDASADTRLTKAWSMQMIKNVMSTRTKGVDFYDYISNPMRHLSELPKQKILDVVPDAFKSTSDSVKDFLIFALGIPYTKEDTVESVLQQITVGDMLDLLDSLEYDYQIDRYINDYSDFLKSGIPEYRKEFKQKFSREDIKNEVLNNITVAKQENEQRLKNLSNEKYIKKLKKSYTDDYYFRKRKLINQIKYNEQNKIKEEDVELLNDYILNKVYNSYSPVFDYKHITVKRIIKDYLNGKLDLKDYRDKFNSLRNKIKHKIDNIDAIFKKKYNKTFFRSGDEYNKLYKQHLSLSKIYDKISRPYVDMYNRDLDKQILSAKKDIDGLPKYIKDIYDYHIKSKQAEDDRVLQEIKQHHLPETPEEIEAEVDRILQAREMEYKNYVPEHTESLEQATRGTGRFSKQELDKLSEQVKQNIEDTKLFLDSEYNIIKDRTNTITNLIMGNNNIGYQSINKNYVQTQIVKLVLVDEDFKIFKNIVEGNYDYFDKGINSNYGMLAAAFKSLNTPEVNKAREFFNNVYSCAEWQDDMLAKISNNGNTNIDAFYRILDILENDMSRFDNIEDYRKGITEDIIDDVFKEAINAGNPTDISISTIEEIIDYACSNFGKEGFRFRISSDITNDIYKYVKSEILDKIYTMEGVSKLLDVNNSGQTNEMYSYFNTSFIQLMDTFRTALSDIKKENRLYSLTPINLNDFSATNGIRPYDLVLNNSKYALKYSKDKRADKYLSQAANKIFGDLYKKSDKTNIINMRFGSTKRGDMIIGIANLLEMDPLEMMRLSYNIRFKDLNKMHDLIWYDLLGDTARPDHNIFVRVDAMISGINEDTYPYISDIEAYKTRMRNLFLVNYIENYNLNYDEYNMFIKENIKENISNPYKHIDNNFFKMQRNILNKVKNQEDLLRFDPDIKSTKLNSIKINVDAINSSNNIFKNLKGLFKDNDEAAQEFSNYFKTRRDQVLVYMNEKFELSLMNTDDVNNMRRIMSSPKETSFAVMSRDDYWKIINKSQPIKLPKILDTMHKCWVLPSKLFGLFLSVPYMFKNITSAYLQNVTANGFHPIKAVETLMNTSKEYHMWKNIYQLATSNKSIYDQFGSFDDVNMHWLDLFQKGDAKDTFLKNLKQEAIDNPASKESIDELIHFLKHANEKQLDALKEITELANTNAAFGDLIDIQRNVVINRNKVQNNDLKREQFKQYDNIELSSIKDSTVVPGNVKDNLTNFRLKNDRPNPGFNSWEEEYNYLNKLTNKSDLELHRMHIIKRYMRSEGSLNSLNKFQKYIGMKKWMDINEDIEIIFRMSMMKEQLAMGFDISQAAQKVMDTHFIYNDKSLATKCLELAMPFITYPIKAANLFTDLTDNSIFIKLMYEWNKYSWGDEDASGSDYLLKRKAQGDIPVGNRLLHLGNAFTESLMTLADPINAANDKLNPWLKMPIDAITQPKYPRYGQVTGPLYGPYQAIKESLQTNTPPHPGTWFGISHAYNNYQNSYYKGTYRNYPKRSYMYNNLYTRGGYSRVAMNMQQTTLNNLKYRVGSIIYNTRYRH